jgi:hypothetical protein
MLGRGMEPICPIGLASFAESVQGFRGQRSEVRGQRSEVRGQRRSDSGRCFSSDLSRPLSIRMHSL